MDFKKIAQQATTLAQIMEGREKGDTKDIIKAGTPVTIDDFEPLIIIDAKTKKEEKVYAYTVAEYPQHFFFAGFILKKIFEGWVASYDSYEDCIEEYRESGGVMVKLSASKTKNAKNDITAVEVIV